MHDEIPPQVPALLTSKPRTEKLCCEHSEWLANWNPNPDDSLPPEIVAALPAEIRAHISNQLTRRRLIANRLRLAEMYARWATT